ALVALVLFSLMIGIRTEAGPSGQLIYWTRFDDLAAMVAAVFGGSIVVELLRQWWGPVGTIRGVPPSVQSALAVARRVSRHRHGGIRRDHPSRHHQLAKPDRRPERRHRHSPADLVRYSADAGRRRACGKTRHRILPDPTHRVPVLSD